MKRRMLQRTLVFPVLSMIVATQAPAQSIDAMMRCITQSATAAVNGAIEGLLGIPESNETAPVLYASRAVEACFLNVTVALRNRVYKQLLGHEVAEYRKLDSLFTWTELVIGFGDAAGTEPELGRDALSFLRLVPAAFARDPLRVAAGGATPITRARAALEALGQPRLDWIWNTTLASADVREHEAAIEGARTAMEVSTAAELDVQDLARFTAQLEAEIRSNGLHSGRARQLETLAELRRVLATAQRLRAEASAVRIAADRGGAAPGTGPLDRVASWTFRSP